MFSLQASEFLKTI